ncbi:efflux RND transporter periplasmic adaptor subunit [Devosia sp. 2618]|uniref:efflux RND transporter periplasmic adaptor subunit n=1 Tax=Devosia sp. 2618 TaxID=3156454 RepID=UPI003397D709
MDNATDKIESIPTKSGKKAWFWSAASLAVLVGLGLVFLSNETPSAPLAATVSTPTVERAMRLHPVEIVLVEPRQIQEYVRVSGTIYPLQEAAIASQVSGLAETVAVRPGDHVAAGDLLVEVGTTDLQLQLDQQRATMATTMVQLQAAQALLDRTQLLADKGLSAQTALDNARAEVDRLTATITSQQTQVTLAETNLRRARVAAPFAGTVSARSIEPGQIVNPGTTMLSLVDLSSVRVEVIVGLSSIGKVQPGQAVNLTVPGMPNTLFSGVVDRISPVAEAGTRSIKVHLTLDNAEGKLRGGMFVTGEIVVQQANDVLAVPTAAVQSRDDERFVMAVVDGVVRERAIEVGSGWEGGSMLEARTGLAAGDTIVATKLSGLRDGASVIIEAN